VLPFRSRVKIEIYNLLGQIVVTLVDMELEAGFHRVTWEAGTAGGVYVCRLEATATNDPEKRFVAARKMILVR